MFRLDVVCSVVFTQPSHILYTSRWHSPQLARQGRPRHCRPGGPATDSAARGEGTPTRSIRQQGGRMNGNDPHLSQPVPFQQPELPPFRLADLTAGSHVDSPDPHPDLIDSPDLADPAVSRGAQQHPDLAERSTPPHPEQPPAASMVGTQALDPWNAPPGDSFASPPPVWEKPAASVEGFTQVWNSGGGWLSLLLQGDPDSMTLEPAQVWKGSTQVWNIGRPIQSNTDPTSPSSLPPTGCHQPALHSPPGAAAGSFGRLQGHRPPPRRQRRCRRYPHLGTWPCDRLLPVPRRDRVDGGQGRVEG